MRKQYNYKYSGKKKGDRTKRDRNINYDVFTCITQIMSVMLRIVLWWLEKYR